MDLSVENAIIDQQLQSLLTSMQITHLNPIQWEALEKGLFYHSSLLVCTPSGSGKTLIGIMGLAHILLNNLGKCVYLVPYKALASEKAKQFKQILSPFHFVVQEVTGDSEDDLQIDDQVDLIITTFEKCDALLRANNPFLTEVSGIVIDEIHEMGSPHRGARLEFLIVRLLTSLRHVQIIALSATIANIDQVYRWFKSFNLPIELIHNDNRPVPLSYTLQITPHKLTVVKSLIRDCLGKGGQVLIFVNRRKDCISMAKNLVNVVKNTLSEEEKRQCLKGQTQLKNHHTVAQELTEVIGTGVAYHNASLNSFDRHTVERLYLQHHIKVLVATTTLAAGINLPARAVIIYDIIQHRKHYNLEDGDYHNPAYVMALEGQGVIKPHSPNLLFQMLGRAGRKGFDTKGDGYILCRDDKEHRFARSFYFAPHAGPNHTLIPKYALLVSQLNSTPTLQEIILLTIAGHPSISEPQIFKILQKTFYFFCLADSQEIDPLRDQIREFLFLDRMTLPYFLQAYGHPSASRVLASEVSFKLTKGSPSHIAGTVFYIQSQFHCEIKLTQGFYCSCRPSRRVTFEKANDNTFVTKLCVHQTLFIRYLNNLEDSPLPGMLRTLLPRMLKHEYIFESLKRAKLIAQVPRSNLYSITSLGLLATSLYLYPHELTWVKKIVETFALTSEEVMLDKFIQLYLFQANRNYQKVMDVITAWISEFTMQDLLAHHAKLGVGDVFTITRDVARCGEMFRTVARFLGEMDVAQTCLRMSQQIAHGIKAELVPLMENFPNMSRNQARIFYNAGLTSVSGVTMTLPLTIHRKTQIPLARIMKILQTEKIAKVVPLNSGPLDQFLSSSPYFKKDHENIA
jgi:replicative superfamily II helicase